MDDLVRLCHDTQARRPAPRRPPLPARRVLSARRRRAPGGPSLYARPSFVRTPQHCAHTRRSRRQASPGLRLEIREAALGAVSVLVQTLDSALSEQAPFPTESLKSVVADTPVLAKEVRPYFPRIPGRRVLQSKTLKDHSYADGTRRVRLVRGEGRGVST